MHATDPLLRAVPATALAEGNVPLTPTDLTPEQLALLAQVFRNALQPDAPARDLSLPTAPTDRHVSSPIAPDQPPAVHDDTAADLGMPEPCPAATQPLPQSPVFSPRYAPVSDPSATPVPFSTQEPTHPTPPAPPNTHDKEKPAAPEEQPLALTLGASVLESIALQSRASEPSVVAPPVTASPIHRIEKLEQVISETVTRMLVSDPLHDGRRELRISLHQDVLPQTEVRLWRDAGRLHVEFVSTSASVEQTRLTDHLPRLSEAIHQRQPQLEAPVVSVRLGGETGQPGDGRSRQHYQPLVEDDAHA